MIKRIFIGLLLNLGVVNLGLAQPAGNQAIPNINQTFENAITEAEKGNADAQLSLAIMYAQGSGVPQDKVEAARWMRKAAEQNKVDAEFYLGLMYEVGEGVTPDDAEAVNWYIKSAEQGHANAQFQLANIYWQGKGMGNGKRSALQDNVQAYLWFTISDKLGNKKALASRAELEKIMTPEQIAEGQSLASEWRPKKPNTTTQSLTNQITPIRSKPSPAMPHLGAPRPSTPKQGGAIPSTPSPGASNPSTPNPGSPNQGTPNQ